MQAAIVVAIVVVAALFAALFVAHAFVICIVLFGVKTVVIIMQQNARGEGAEGKHKK